MSGRACTKRQYTTKCPFVGTFKPNQAENPSGQGFGALYHPARGPASLNRSRRGGRRLSPPRSAGRSAPGAERAGWGGVASPLRGEVGARNARSQVGRCRLPTQWGGRRAERAQPGGEVSPPHAVGRSARGARAARWGGFASPRSGEVGARSARSQVGSFASPRSGEVGAQSAPGGDVHLPTPRVAG